MSNHLDTILLDANCTFVQKVTLTIDKHLKFASYNDTDGNNKANILFGKGLYGMEYLIQSSANISFFDIHLGTRLWKFYAVFHMDKEGRSLTLENCVVDYADGYGDFISYTENFKSGLILKTKFYGYDGDGHRTGSSGNERKDLKQKTRIHSDASIQFEQCLFTKHSIPIDIPIVSVVRSVFIDSSLSSSNIRDLQINQTQFFHSSTELFAGYYLPAKININDCIFQKSRTNIYEGDYPFMLIIDSSDSAAEITIKNCKFEGASFGALKLEGGPANLINLTFADNYIGNQPMIPTDRAAALTTISTFKMKVFL